jgi:YD repeat-containing protein
MADGVRYEHDEDGNQTLKSGPDGDWHYRWNGHGMLREVERPDGVRVAFDYDPFARRTAKRTLSAAGTVDQEVQFVWDGHNVTGQRSRDDLAPASGHLRARCDARSRTSARPAAA